MFGSTSPSRHSQAPITSQKIENGMVIPRFGVFGSVRLWAAGIVIGGSALASTGCSLLPTTDDIRSATTTVKDTVSGKARKDKLNKTYAEARILERRKDYAQAERLYRELLVAEPKSRDCYHRLGVIAAVQGKYVEAHQNYQAALRCSQPTAELLSDIGYSHYLQQQLPLAEQALRSAVALDPQHAAATNNLARVVGEQGNLDEAYDLFRKVNGPAEAECNFAYLCAQSGDLPAAQAHFSRALGINPDMRVAAEAMLQVTQTMQRRQDEARAQLAQLARQATQPPQPGAPPATAATAAGLPQPTAMQPTAALQQTPQVAPQYSAAASPIVQAGYAQPLSTASGVAQAGGYTQAAAAQAGGVQLASANADPTLANRAAQALAAAPQQRLIEVYRGGPRSAAGSAQVAAAAHASSQQTNHAASHAPASNFPASASIAGGAASGNVFAAAPGPGTQPNFQPSSAPGPFSFPSTPSPQYLQPSSQSRKPAAGDSSGQPAPQDDTGIASANTNIGRQNGRLLSPAARPSVLSFPQQR